MPHPIVINNNFIRNKDTALIDNVSKLYIVLGYLIGLNRVSILGIKMAFKIIASVFPLIFSLGFIYWIVTTIGEKKLLLILVTTKVTQYISVTCISSLLWKRVRMYYNVLELFDNQIGCIPKTTTSSWLVLADLIFVVPVLLFVTFYYNIGRLAPMNLVCCVEIHYFAHLTTLLCARIHLMNRFVESMLPNADVCLNDKRYYVLKNNFCCQVKVQKLMELYSTLMDAHDKLVDAMMWQVVLILVTSFVFLLVLSYNSVALIWQDDWNIGTAVINTSMTVCEIMTMFSLCLCCDQVRAEVRRLRELLSFTLYDAKLSKRDRNIVRAVLDLAENHDLTFSLLHMVDISISLPFSYIGLLLTYLIILLQFQKVIAVAFEN